MKNKLFIFDFDGTIADTIEISRSIFNEVLHKYNFPEVEVKNDDFVKDVQNINIFEVLRKFGFSEEKIEDFLLFLRDEYSKRDVEPFDGIIDIIKNLHKNGVTLAIVSSNHADSIKSFLEDNSITEIFTCVLGGNDDTSKVKKIESIIKKTNAQIQNVYYIGDTTGDIKEGKEAKVNTVGVTWGVHEEERIKKASPDIILREPKDLLTI